MMKFVVFRVSNPNFGIASNSCKPQYTKSCANNIVEWMCEPNFTYYNTIHPFHIHTTPESLMSHKI